MDADATIAAIRENLRELGLPVTDGPTPSHLEFDVTGTTGVWTTYLWLRAAENQIVLHSVVRFAVPAERRDAVALYLTRANFGLAVGNFELDLDDGELRFKTSIDFGESPLDLEMLRRHVGISLRTVDRYLPGVVSVIDGASPKEAARALEA